MILGLSGSEDSQKVAAVVTKTLGWKDDDAKLLRLRGDRQAEPSLVVGIMQSLALESDRPV